MTNMSKNNASLFLILIAFFTVAIILPLPVIAQKHIPIHLMTKDGDIINPLTGENADQPYSPYMTCGSCHDYDTIVQGYHFQQGAEKISDDFNKEYPWVLSDGMFGKF